MSAFTSEKITQASACEITGGLLAAGVPWTAAASPGAPTSLLQHQPQTQQQPHQQWHESAGSAAGQKGHWLLQLTAVQMQRSTLELSHAWALALRCVRKGAPFLRLLQCWYSVV